MLNTPDTPAQTSSSLVGFEPIAIDGQAPAGQVGSVWHLFGLRDSPFFQDVLQPASDASRPASLFVGRTPELRRLARRIIGTTSTRFIVQGGPGVGKTSFVNRLKCELARYGVLSHEKPVRITPDMNCRALTAEVLKVLLRIRHEARVAAARRSSVLLRKAKEFAAGDKFWTYIARLVKGQDLLNAGLAIGAFGGSYERGRIPAEIPDLSLYDELEEAVATLINETRDHPDTNRQILIHMNNLEIFPPEQAARTASVLRDFRDYLMIPGAQWIFVGPTGVEMDIFGAYQSLSGVFPLASHLEPLSADEVRAILERRYEHLKRGMAFTPPVEIEQAVSLYAIYHGDLRQYLRLLDEATDMELGVRGDQSLAAEEIVAFMAPRLRDRLSHGPHGVEIGLLRALFRDCRSTDKLSVADIGSRAHLDSPAAFDLVCRLVRGGALHPPNGLGPQAIYHPAGDASIAFGLPS
jgi:hypothetical protein